MSYLSEPVLDQFMLRSIVQHSSFAEFPGKISNTDTHLYIAVIYVEHY